VKRNRRSCELCLISSSAVSFAGLQRNQRQNPILRLSLASDFLLQIMIAGSNEQVERIRCRHLCLEQTPTGTDGCRKAGLLQCQHEVPRLIMGSQGLVAQNLYPFRLVSGRSLAPACAVPAQPTEPETCAMQVLCGRKAGKLSTHRAPDRPGGRGESSIQRAQSESMVRQKIRVCLTHWRTFISLVVV